jgi:hypothetical protein
MFINTFSSIQGVIDSVVIKIIASGSDVFLKIEPFLLDSENGDVL